MFGVQIEVTIRSHLHQLPQVHDCDPVGDVLHHRQVVCNHDIGEPCFSLSESKRLITWAWMETSSALTGSSATIDSGRMASGPGHTDPLPLAAREFVGVSGHMVG